MTSIPTPAATPLPERDAEDRALLEEAGIAPRAVAPRWWNAALAMSAIALLLTGAVYTGWPAALMSQDRWWARAVIAAAVTWLVAIGIGGIAVHLTERQRRRQLILETRDERAMKLAALRGTICLGMSATLLELVRRSPDERKPLQREGVSGEVWRWGHPRWGWTLEIVLVEGRVTEIIGA